MLEHENCQQFFLYNLILGVSQILWTHYNFSYDFFNEDLHENLLLIFLYTEFSDMIFKIFVNPSMKMPLYYLATFSALKAIFRIHLHSGGL